MKNLKTFEGLFDKLKDDAIVKPTMDIQEFKEIFYKYYKELHGSRSYSELVFYKFDNDFVVSEKHFVSFGLYYDYGKVLVFNSLFGIIKLSTLIVRGLVFVVSEDKAEKYREVINCFAEKGDCEEYGEVYSMKKLEDPTDGVKVIHSTDIKLAVTEFVNMKIYGTNYAIKMKKYTQ